MALSDRPAERHREIGRVFTARVRGTRSWDLARATGQDDRLDAQTRLLGFIGRDPYWTPAS